MRAVFLDFGSVTRGDMDCTQLERAVSPWRYYDETAPGEVLERIRDAEVVVCNKFSMNREIIAAASRLKLICIAATGYNNIDLATAAERGVPVCNVRGYATPAVVQHTFMLMLNLSCNFLDYHQLVRDGRWQDSAHFCPLDFGIHELAGKVLGIVGYGDLGRAVAGVAAAFGMRVLVAERKGEATARVGRVLFDEALQQADFVSLHCPLLADTRGMMGQHEFDLMKPSAYLINTARGALVDEAALLEALNVKRIAGAGLDVLHQEPPAHDNALLRYAQSNLIVTPHVAWASRESRQRLLDQIADNIDNFYHGRPFSQVMDAVQD